MTQEDIYRRRRTDITIFIEKNFRHLTIDKVFSNNYVLAVRNGVPGFFSILLHKNVVDIKDPTLYTDAIRVAAGYNATQPDEEKLKAEISFR